MFDGLKLTNKGIELLVNLLNGHRVQFTHIKMGNGNAPSSIAPLTDLVSVKQTLPIARNSIIDTRTLLIGSNVYGVDVREAFYWKEVGVFAKDLDGDNIEYLFTYDNCGDQASYIPAGGAVAEQLIDLNVVVGNVENVEVVIDTSLVFATVDSMNDAINELDSTLKEKIDTDVASVNKALTNHIQNTNNPHSVTKSQVGLGSVENCGIASTNEAKAGNVNNKYMTPQRVKEAVEGFGVISDGNTIIKVGGTQPSVQSGKTIIWIDTSS